MQADRSEGDINLGPQRERWMADALGPRSRALVERDAAAFLRQSLSTPCLSAIRKAEGIWIEDMDGRRFMDFHGNSVHHIGYSHPRLVAALKTQMDELSFAPRRFACEPAAELAERLAAVAPTGPGSRVLFAPGGSEGIEIALKLARVATGRFKTISFWDAFHGAGFGASGVGGEALFRSHGIGPLLAGAEHVAPFACARCPYGFDPAPGGGPDLDVCRMTCARMLRYVLEKEGDVAAVVAEPVRAVPYVPPPGFWAEVRRACDAAGALLIFDEIPTGLGKTGSLFSHEPFGAQPDILVLGKALGGAMLPLAAVIARPGLDVAADRALGHYTHEKNPLLARAGLTTLDIIRDEGLTERAANLGAFALDRLRDLTAALPGIADIRGAGLLIGVELADHDGRSAADRAEATFYAALAAGVSLKISQASVLTLSPPLTIAKSDLEQALAIVAQAISTAGVFTP